MKAEMNVLIVDDEYVTRMGLRTCLANVEGVRIIGECANGKQALDIVKKERNHIDLILLDLNMPCMDGLQFLSLLDRSFPGKIVVLSGYDDLEYVKEAMKLGAYDYFHKPTMTPQKIIRMVQDIQKKIREEEEVTNERSEWIKHFIENPTNEIGNQCLKWFAFMPPYLYTVLISVNDNPSLGSNYFIKKCLIAWKKEEQILAEFISWGEGKILMVDFLEVRSQLLQKETVWRRCQAIVKRLKEELNLSVSLGVSQVVSSPLELKKCILQAENALNKEFYTGRGSINYYEQETERYYPDQANDKQLSISEIWQAFEKLNKEEVYQALSRYFDNLKRHKNRNEIISEAVELLSRLKAILEKEGLYKEKDEIVYETVFSISYFSDLKEYVKCIFGKCIDAINEYRNTQYSPIVNEAIQYIRSNFKKDISLESLAKIVRTNPSYLSRVFKQQTGYTISEYITKLRIEKAKELLLQHHLRINEVALSVGYVNERYFIQVFKRETGCTPSEFRQAKK